MTYTIAILVPSPLISLGLESIISSDARFAVTCDHKNAKKPVYKTDLMIVEHKPALFGENRWQRALPKNGNYLCYAQEKIFPGHTALLYNDLACQGIILETDTRTTVIEKVAHAVTNKDPEKRVFPDEVIQPMLRYALETEPKMKTRGLTEKERLICSYIKEGYKNREIAKFTFLSEQTVKNHLHRIFEKTGVQNRSELANYIINESQKNRMYFQRSQRRHEKR